MLSLFMFMSVYFSIPNINAHEAFRTKCENQKEYFLYETFFSGLKSKILDDSGNVLYYGETSSRTRSKIKSFYCIDNDLYILLAEYKENGSVLEELNIKKLIDDSLVEQDSIESIYGDYSIINGNELIYANYNDKYFYKTIFAKNFGVKTQYLYAPKHVYYENALYFEDIDSLLYIEEDTNNLILHNSDSSSTLLYATVTKLHDAKRFNDKWYFLIQTENRVIKIIDEDANLYHEYTLESSFKKAFLNINENGIYALVLDTNNLLKVITVPEFNSSKNEVKDISDTAFNIYRDSLGYFFLENGNGSTHLNDIIGECSKPEAPQILSDIIGVQSIKPSSFTYTNFNEDLFCFKSFQMEISSNERFTSSYYGDMVNYYNENSSHQTYQFYNNFVFEDNKAYYIRANYNNILTSSEYFYIRLIITDLGEITKFEILDTSSNSKIYTNEEMVNINLEKSGNVEKVQLSLNENFKDEDNKDIADLDFNNNFNFLLPEEEKEYTYYIRPVVIDSSNNNIMGGHQAKTARITLDKTSPIIPKIKTENQAFFNDNIKIEWEFSEDNLSGIENYKLRVVDSLSNSVDIVSKENTENFYTPELLLNNGIYTFFISACDKSENCSLESKTNFTVEEKDNFKPYKPSINNPKHRDIVDEMPFEISWDKSNDPENDEITYTLIISENKDFSNPEIELNLIKNLFTNITYLSEGHYYLKLFAVDSYGNFSSEEIIEFDVIEPNSKTSSSSGCSF